MEEHSRLEGDDWLAVVHAPFRVYAIVASADAPASPVQFRTLLDEVRAAREAFDPGSIGARVIDALAADEEGQWSGFQESSWSPEDGLKRAHKALGTLPAAESDAFRDWLVAVGARIAEARRVVGATPVSEGEAAGMAVVARRLDRPLPDLPTASEDAR